MRQTVREYRGMLWMLNEHEGWLLSRRWPLAALGLFAAVWAVPLAGAVGSAYLARGGDGLGWAVLSAVVTLGLGGLGAAWSQRRPWHRLCAERLAAYCEQADPRDYASALIAREDFSSAMHSLRRAGLNAIGRSSTSPPDAPHLNLALYVYRPVLCVCPGQESVSVTSRLVLHAAGVKARVDGRLANGEAIPTLAPMPCEAAATDGGSDG